MRFLRFTLILLQSTQVFAVNDFPFQAFGDQVGNGGKAVVCRDSQGKIAWAVLLDFYESKKLYELKPNFDTITPLGKARAAVYRLRHLDPKRMQLYLELIDAFWSNTRFTGPLFDTPDSDHILRPPRGCEIEQLAIQKKPTLPRDRLYTIDPEIWNGLVSDDQRAGLILHEIIYHGAIARGHENSIGVRYLNAQIASNNLANLQQAEYDSKLQAAKLYTERWQDQESGREWAFLSGVKPTWRKAADACQKIEKSNLPRPQAVEGSADKLLASPLFQFVANSLFGETWSSYRRPEDGRFAINLWSDSNISRFYRQGNNTANIVCLKTYKGGNLP